MTDQRTGRVGQYLCKVSPSRSYSKPRRQVCEFDRKKDASKPAYLECRRVPTRPQVGSTRLADGVIAGPISRKA